MDRAVQRGLEVQEPVVEQLPVIRSGELFTVVPDDMREDYFDTLSMAPANMVQPEAVFGTNGWARRLSETGARPEDARRMFDMTWESMTPVQRRDAAFGNALERFYSAGMQEEIADTVNSRALDISNAFSFGHGNTVAGLSISSDPSTRAAYAMKTMLGEC